MSYRVVEWVMQQHVPDNACKLVLMVLGTHADDAGRCFPRVRTLGREASMSMRTVHRVLQRLASEHPVLMSWEQQSGAANIYQLHCPTFEAKPTPDKQKASATKTAEPRASERNDKRADPRLPRGGRTENHHFNHHNPKYIELNPEPRARGLPRRTRGELEMSLASRVGSTAGEGIEMLSALPSGELDQLLARERRGTLTDLDIERVRSKWDADGWKRRREGWHRAFAQFKASNARHNGEPE